MEVSSQIEEHEQQEQFLLPKVELPNGFSREASPSATPSGFVSREASLPIKAANQLKVVSNTTTDDEYDSDEELLRFVPQRPVLPYSTLPTGLCYDARMRFHTELNPPKDRNDFHPEDPRRIFWIYRAICESGMFYDKDLSSPDLVAQPMKMIEARHATKAEILTVHEEKHYEFIKETSITSEYDLERMEKAYDSVYFSPSTYNAALLSAGAAIETCLAVAGGRGVKNAIAVIRPPGHHAECHRPMGFCHFDNVAVAANAVRDRCPHIRKILILDWDVHHGNGIQQAFESDPNVLYISIHVHENGSFYPMGPYGDHLHCGLDAGVGKNINIPWPCKGMGDADYLFAFQQIVMPVAFDFNPEFVIIAAGFDAAHGDQLGGCFVTPACYSHMTHMLMSLADGKVVACLEGGYNLNAIAMSALAVSKTLMGEAPPKIQETSPTRKAVETVMKVLQHQSKYWKCLYPKDPTQEFDGLPNTHKMHDVVRSYQAKSLYDSFKMIPLWVFREKLSKSFESQVLATTNYKNNVPLLVIFHEPPEVVGKLDRLYGKVDLHRLLMADPIKDYIAWAVSHKIAVIDCNIPKFLTGISDPDGSEEAEMHKVDVATEELAIYIWENYIETNESKRVVLFGVGRAYKAVLDILNTRNWENIGQFAGATGFLGTDSPLRAVTESFMNDFSRTYWRQSHIIVARGHAVYEPERKRLGKKFGRCRQSEFSGMSRMLQEHAPEVQQWILEVMGLPLEPVAEDVSERLELEIETERKDPDPEDTIMVTPAKLTAPPLYAQD